TTNYLKAFDTNGAFYINRLPKIGVYLKNEDSFDAICWKDIRHHFKKNDAASLETEVYLGKKEKIGSRLLIVPVPEQVAAGRIRKAKQGGNRKKGYAISGEYKAKAHFNLFITNVPAKVLSAEKVILAYRLRWQIEILFKTWKSHLNIHKCKPMKIERFKCQLIGNLIWILISNKLFQITKSVITRHDNSKSCSPIKFFKFSKYIKQELRAVVHV
ncbi:transposase, partial [Saccharicrinis sp. 156]|uniref:transposase n=1 Tax=Saccharicrinis sp. 156 TaxID=3417574 RepID=UPI003D33F72E